MPVTWSLDSDRSVILIRYADPFSFEDWVTMFTELRSNPTFIFQRDLGLLVDRTTIDRLPEPFIRRVAAFVAAYP
jgi:hypothetical protein